MHPFGTRHGRLEASRRHDRAGHRQRQAARRPRGLALGLLASSVICPCHVLAAVAATLLGLPMLSPAAQDGIHAVYAPAAVLAGAALLRLGRLRRLSN